MRGKYFNNYVMNNITKYPSLMSICTLGYSVNDRLCDQISAVNGSQCKSSLNGNDHKYSLLLLIPDIRSQYIALTTI